MAQQVTNPTNIHDDSSSLRPHLTQWVKDLALPNPAQVADAAQMPRCCGCGVGRQLQLCFDL